MTDRTEADRKADILAAIKEIELEREDREAAETERLHNLSLLVPR